ncbi:PepSY-associated TM helix domain-containing protein [Sphingomonas sp.]|jgi:uncharacterized iron-regulated membrane protein|uniref:PepSY-associated TM helix domain-containing protein n=1 Tax=Sphingomonas sp. TaxID=28214 RepID=UPI002D7F7F7C|nr:PepSY-associated TM helix domain-containing protein [Sphingomonas sp.]HEU0044242.1 PepSY-associated TM helix domain-containing protein [Sphingomonas sp.]
MMTKLKWRRTWFQVHKWIGLILAVLIIPISLTGSALVWHDALERMIEPQRFATSGDTLLAPEIYVAAATTRLKPGERIAQITMPDPGPEHGDPVTVAAAPAAAGPPRGGPPPRTLVFLDPPTAQVLDVATNSGGLVRFLHVLHGSLQIPGGWGRSIVGWIGVAMMLSAFTGLWLWWPTTGSMKRALRWGRHRNTDTNIHQTFGFWVALPLFVLSLTGAWISFPRFFGSLVGQAPQQQRGPDRAALARAKPLDRTALTLPSAIARARAVAPGDLRQVSWPTTLKPDWSVQLKPTNGPPATIAVTDGSGVATLTPRPGGQGGVARWMRRIHDGTDMGMVWQIIIFIGGIIPAVLAVTGIIMWWRARGWKADLARRQAAKQAVA